MVNCLKGATQDGHLKIMSTRLSPQNVFADEMLKFMFCVYDGGLILRKELYQVQVLFYYFYIE